MDRIFRIARIASVTAWLILLFASCTKKENEDVTPVEQLSLRYDDLDFVLPANGPTGAVDMEISIPAHNDIATLLAQNGYAMEDVKEIRTVEARALIFEPENHPFYAVESIHLELVDLAGVPTGIARKEVVPNGTSVLDLTTEPRELSHFFEADTVGLTTRLEMSEPMGQETTLRFAVTFRVLVAK